MGCTLCEHCTAECCHYLALPLDEPETRRDFDDIRWYLMHEGVIVFVEDGDWYIQVRTRCRNLRSDFKCGVYETRPTICREYKAEDCDYVGGDYKYDHVFTEPEQIVAYAKDHFGRRKKKTPARKKRRWKAGSHARSAAGAAGR
jgi:Fe-S-cluster containining protein